MSYKMILQKSQTSLSMFHNQMKIIKIKNIGNYLLIIQKTQKQESNSLYIAITENQSSLECSNLKKYQQSISCQFDKEINLSRVNHGARIQQIWYLILQDPLQIFFITQKSKKPIKILLKQEYLLKNIAAYFSSEISLKGQQQKTPIQTHLYIYGYNEQKSKNVLFNINLMTFDTKQLWNGTGYSPVCIKKMFTYFLEDRLYVFGGVNKKDQSVEELMWTYDFQKGYWFALQMKYKQVEQNFQQCIFTQYSSGKIVLFKQENFYLLQIYQSKLSKLLNLNQDCVDKQSKRKIKGMFKLDNKLYLYTQNEIIPFSIRLQTNRKQKIVKQLNKNEHQVN